MSEFNGTAGWSAKREVLQAHAHPDMAFNQAIVVGDADSNELVALAFGYSPEGCAKRARLIAAAPALLEALLMIAATSPTEEPGEPDYDRCNLGEYAYAVSRKVTWATAQIARNAISLACGEQADG